MQGSVLITVRLCLFKESRLFKLPQSNSYWPIQAHVDIIVAFCYSLESITLSRNKISFQVTLLFLAIELLTLSISLYECGIVFKNIKFYVPEMQRDIYNSFF